MNYLLMIVCALALSCAHGLPAVAQSEFQLWKGDVAHSDCYCFDSVAYAYLLEYTSSCERLNDASMAMHKASSHLDSAAADYADAAKKERAAAKALIDANKKEYKKRRWYDVGGGALAGALIILIIL